LVFAETVRGRESDIVITAKARPSRGRRGSRKMNKNYLEAANQMQHLSKRAIHHLKSGTLMAAITFERKVEWYHESFGLAVLSL
jgi:hypothetical protein